MKSSYCKPCAHRVDTISGISGLAMACCHLLTTAVAS